MNETIKKVEAILFAVGRAISEQELLELTLESKHNIHEALVELKKQYESRDSPLLIAQEGDLWKLTVHEKYVNVVHKITPHTELSKAMLETLAVIAWKQPATQSEIVKIRTNKAYEHIAELEKMGYIAKHKQGRTYLIKVTGKFYDYFDLPEGGVKEIFKDVKDVEEAQTKLFEEAAKPETVGKLEVFEVPKDEQVQEVEFEETEVPEEKKETVEDFLEENKVKPAPQEIEEGLVEEKQEKKEEAETAESEEEKTEERELDPELEEFAKEKKKKE